MKKLWVILLASLLAALPMGLGALAEVDGEMSSFPIR